MKWLAKAILQKGLSSMPFGEEINYLLQRHVTHSLPMSERQVMEKVRQAVVHFRNFTTFCDLVDLETVIFYEFGAGWDLAIPLTYYALGVRRQLLLDRIKHLRFSLINDSIRRLAQHSKDIENSMSVSLKVKSAPISSREELLEAYGVEYRAPAEAKDTGLASESIDFISNTATLEHIPAKDLRNIMIECRRILRRGGIVSCDIDLQDHYSYFDRSISCYNFLRFQESQWNLVNSPLQFQNRWRYPDYLAIMQESGLEVIHQEVERPSPNDLALLRTMKLSEDLQGRYSLEDLGVKHLLLVGRKG